MCERTTVFLYEIGGLALIVPSPHQRESCTGTRLEGMLFAGASNRFEPGAEAACGSSLAKAFGGEEKLGVVSRQPLHTS